MNKPMNKTAHALLLGLLCLALAVAAPACKKKPPAAAPVPTPAPVATPVPTPTPTPKPVEVQEPFREEKPAPPVELSADEIKARGLLQTVYFDLDKHDLTDSTRATLRANAEWLKAHTEVEGRDRGALRRARHDRVQPGAGRAARPRGARVPGQPRRRRGTDAHVTYGEERPAAPGHDESAWSKNRRAEFAVE